MPSFIYQYGRAEVAVPSGQKVAVLTRGTARVFLKQVTPNQPPSFVEQTACTGRQRLYGTFTGAVTVVIETDSEQAYYEVGTAPSVNLLLPVRQADPTAKTVAVTLTGAELLTKIITGVHTAGATQAYTLPTGTLLDAALVTAGTPFEVGDAFDWTIINNSLAAADTITVTAGTDHTVVGTMVCQSLHSTTGLIHGNAIALRTRKTAANTFVTYRLG